MVSSKVCECEITHAHVLPWWLGGLQSQEKAADSTPQEHQPPAGPARGLEKEVKDDYKYLRLLKVEISSNS